MSGDAAKKKANMDLAIKADACYTAGDYAAALEVLHRIEKSIGDKEDPRLLHNLRLTESAVKGFKDAGTLRAGLLAVKAKIRAKHAAKHGSDSAGTPAANQAATSALEGSASGGAEPTSVAADVQTTLALLRDADSDCSILLYNLAAMHFERAHYGAARTVLEHLFRDVEPMEEMVAVAVCLLLLDVLVHCARGNLSSEKVRVAFARQTEEVLGHLEKLAALSTRKGESVGTDGKPLATTAPGADAASSQASGASPGAVPFTPEQVADLEFRVHLYRAKVLLMQAQLKAAKKEIKSALEILQKSKFDLPAAKTGSGAANGNSSSGEGDWASSAPALRSMTALYLKANFEYLRTNYRKALKLLSSCHTTGAMLQQLEGPEGGASLASGSTAALASSGSAGASCVATTGSVGAMYYNNVACVHHKMRKYHAALYYFQRAIASDNETATAEGGSGAKGAASTPPGSNSPGLTRDGRVRAGVGCEVRYNAGLALLLVGQPQAALVKFDEAASLLFDRPQLWLRMAECCVQHYCQQQQQQSPSSPQPGAAAAEGAIVSADSGVGGAVVAGSHAQRRFVLPTEVASDGAASASATSCWLSGPALSSNQCSLAYAVACLHNALFLLAAQAREAARREEEATEGKLGALFGKKVGGGGASTPDNGAAGAASGASGRSGADEKEGDSDEAAAVLGLQAAAYLNLAFVHLSLGDAAAALAATASLLEPRDRATAHAADGSEGAGGSGASGSTGGSLSSSASSSSSCPPALRTLAHMYAAEALVALNKPAEALEHLNFGGDATQFPEALEGSALKLGAALAASSGGSGVGTAASSGGEGAGSGLVLSGASDPSRAQAALYANAACAALVQPGADKGGAPKALAENCARAAVSACPSSSHAQRTLVYVLLRTGQTTEALAWLKLYRTSGQ
jgi:CCR4-NOT transcription complex subunit 10